MKICGKVDWFSVFEVVKVFCGLINNLVEVFVDEYVCLCGMVYIWVYLLVDMLDLVVSLFKFSVIFVCNDLLLLLLGQYMVEVLNDWLGDLL